MHVIGTAGHVDHGKSTLTYALTQIHPDRLEEEQRREMTIDLGFAWLDLPDGERVGIVDVPGHRDFIENMLAGVGGIDAAILVIAADEGVMPQTREHLAILDLLGVPAGLIALTKIDMVDDPSWLELVQLDIMETVQGTVLEGAPLLPVSAVTGEGLPELVQALTAMLASLPARTGSSSPRLPVDRVFTISGFGVVVTGTLLGGPLQVGQEIEIQPSGVTARIRGLQSHEQSVEIAEPGSRVGVNLRGVEKREIKRGEVLGLPGAWHPTTLADAWLRHLPDAARPLAHDDEVKVFAGAAEMIGRVRLIDKEIVLPGEEAFVQLRLEGPLVAANGDHYIVRRASPGETIGGGVILSTAPGRRWKRFRPEVIARFETLLAGDPIQVALLSLENSRGPVRRAGLPLQDAQVASALDTGDLLGNLAAGWVIHPEVWARAVEKVTRILARFHTEQPLRMGMSADALRNRLRLEPDAFEVLIGWLAAENMIAVESSGVLRLPDHDVRFTAAQEAALRKLEAAFDRAPHAPPTVSQASEIAGEPVVLHLIERGDLVRISAEVVLRPDVLREWITFARGALDAGQPLTVATLRDHFQTTRRYALDFLERLDALRITRRQGDDRVRGTGGWEQILPH